MEYKTTISTVNGKRMKRVIIPTTSDHYVWIKGSIKCRAFLHINNMRVEMSKTQLEHLRDIIDAIIKTI